MALLKLKIKVVSFSASITTVDSWLTAVLTQVFFASDISALARVLIKFEPLYTLITAIGPWVSALVAEINTHTLRALTDTKQKVQFVKVGTTITAVNTRQFTIFAVAHPAFWILALQAVGGQVIALLANITLSMPWDFALCAISHRAVNADAAPLLCLVLQAILCLDKKQSYCWAYSHRESPNQGKAGVLVCENFPAIILTVSNNHVDRVSLKIMQDVEFVDEDEEFEDELGEDDKFCHNGEGLQRCKASICFQCCAVNALDKDHRQHINEEVHC